MAEHNGTKPRTLGDLMERIKQERLAELRAMTVDELYELSARQTALMLGLERRQVSVELELERRRTFAETRRGMDGVMGVRGTLKH